MNLVKGFYYSSVASGKISFRFHRTNIMKANIHWYQYFRRISRTPSLIGISNDAEFSAVIEAARQRASIRKHNLEESSSLSKSTNPGKLKSHKDCITWSRALNKYPSTIIGQYGFPLRYVIRESAAPD